MYCFFASIFFFCRSGYILWCPLFFNSRRSVEDIIFRAKSSFLQVWIRLSVAPSTSVVLIRSLNSSKVVPYSCDESTSRLLIRSFL
ncbi:hypothetical protein BDA96_06G035700 [Sorghum bicolor]|uniref:Uncharacterized protein n=2 Tax=Sorghum bicolor TaxID=4558 RepID=A0A921UB70_SORBI|nr:hypothetical protein SORBI_3006G032500 [Sorghum bicolor]KAG0525204.1 hypothetical protein BDA96_06G035700 [Sorghum bicolor]